MRRIAILTGLFAVGLISIGCKHVAGKCDCTHDGANHPMPPIANPYPVVGPTTGGGGAVGSAPATLPVEVMPVPSMPPAKIPMGK